MESSPAFGTFSETLKEFIEKFTASIENDDTLFNKERLVALFSSMRRICEDLSREELAESMLNKTFYEKFIKDEFIPEIFRVWERVLNASTKKESTSKVSLTVGTETPEIEKNQIKLELLSDTKKQTELLNQHLSALNPDVEVPFAAVKLYSATPSETKDFLDGMLQMVAPMLEALPIIPEISVVAGSDHVIVKVAAPKSLELNFMMLLAGHLIAKLPEYDVELRLTLQSGTNFSHLIQNHTDNTVFDLLNGFKVMLEFKNNLAGFLDEIIPMLVEKGQKQDSIKARFLSFALGSISLTTEVNLNLGANELALMANLPKVNIFDKEGILSAAPLGQVKAMREDDMGQMILPNVNSLEGKADVFVSCPFLTAHLNVDCSGALELANSTIDLFSS